MRLFSLALLVAAAVGSGSASAQTAKPKAPATSPAQPQAAQQQQADAPLQQGWIARCSSASRDAPLECAIEQSAVLTKTGQLVVLINIRVPADTRVPVALIQLPLGLNLPIGAKLQVDEGRSVDLPIQTCESRGCYVSTPLANDLLAAMRSGKQLKISFQNMAKETISIPMPLSDFASAYDKIK